MIIYNKIFTLLYSNYKLKATCLNYYFNNNLFLKMYKLPNRQNELTNY